MKNLEVKQKCTVTYVDGGSIRKTPKRWACHLSDPALTLPTSKLYSKKFSFFCF